MRSALKFVDFFVVACHLFMFVPKGQRPLDTVMSNALFSSPSYM